MEPGPPLSRISIESRLILAYELLVVSSKRVLFISPSYLQMEYFKGDDNIASPQFLLAISVLSPESVESEKVCLFYYTSYLGIAYIAL